MLLQSNVCKRISTFQYVTKAKVKLIHNLRRFLFRFDDNAIIRRMQRKFPGVAKSWHPVAMGLLRPKIGVDLAQCFHW